MAASTSALKQALLRISRPSPKGSGETVVRQAVSRRASSTSTGTRPDPRLYGMLREGQTSRISHSDAFYSRFNRTPSMPSRYFGTSRSVGNDEHDKQGQDQAGQPIGQIDPKLSLTFTCTVSDCGHRSTHQFSKNSYEKGIVLVQCPGCKNRHLIADHLGWFKQTAGEARTVEDIVREHGGRVRRGIHHGAVDGGTEEVDYDTIEILSDTHPTSEQEREGQESGAALAQKM